MQKSIRTYATLFIVSTVSLAPPSYSQTVRTMGFSEVAVSLPDPATLQNTAAGVKDQQGFIAMLQIGTETSSRIDAAYNQAFKLQEGFSQDCKKLSDRDVAGVVSLSTRAGAIYNVFTQTSKNFGDALETAEASIKKMPNGQEKVRRENDLRELLKLRVQFQMVTSGVTVTAQSIMRLATSVQNLQKSCAPLQFSLKIDPANLGQKNPVPDNAPPKDNQASSPPPPVTTVPSRIAICMGNRDPNSTLWIRLQSGLYETEYFPVYYGQSVKKTAMADGIGCFDTRPFPSGTCPRELKQAAYKCT